MPELKFEFLTKKGDMYFIKGESLESEKNLEMGYKYYVKAMMYYTKAFEIAYSQLNDKLSNCSKKIDDCSLKMKNIRYFIDDEEFEHNM